jgi:hypothetical protein
LPHNKHILLSKFAILIAIALLIGGCVSSLNNDKGSELARVYKVYLYEADVEGLVPVGTSHHDSIVLVRNYINSWVNTQLMIEMAKRNLVIQQLDLDKQLEDYRNSLIIYHYETELIKQKLDTLVSDEEIEKYYEGHLNDFELKENIVRLHYVIIDNEPEQEELFENIYLLPDSLMLDSLESFSKVYAKSYFLDTANWVRFDDLLDIIPIETYNRELFLKGSRHISLSDEGFIYLLTFVDFRIKDDTSPLEFEQNDIRKIIINKRKMRLIKQLRIDIYEKGVQNNEFEIYHD